MFLNFFKTQTAHAATKIQDAGAILDQAAGPTGIQRDVPLLDMVGDFIGAFLGLVGIVFFVMIVYGAYMWFASAGADDKIKKGRGIIITAISGLMIVLAANALTVFVFDRLTKGNITVPSSGSGLATPWGGPVGGDFGTKPPEPTGCCIDRVGEYNFARRVTTESDCITKQAGDAYSKDLVGQEKTGEAATGVRGTDWDFYTGMDAAKCDEVFACWDKKLGFLWGGMSDSEFDQCLAGFNLDKASTDKVWCYTTKDEFELDEKVCINTSTVGCATRNGVNFGDKEIECLAKKNSEEGGQNFVWCFSPDTKACRELAPESCVAPMQKTGFGDDGKTKCANLGGKVSTYACRYEKINVTPATLGLGAACIPCDCNNSPELNYGCDLGGTTMKLWQQYMDDAACMEAVKKDTGGVLSTSTVAKKESAASSQVPGSTPGSEMSYYFDLGVCLGCFSGQEGTTGCPVDKEIYNSESDCKIKNNILSIGTAEQYCFGSSISVCTKCFCKKTSVGMTCSVNNINYSNLKNFASESLCVDALQIEKNSINSLAKQCGGIQTGVYKNLPLYSELPSGETCSANKELGLGSSAVFSQFCTTDCKLESGKCVAKKTNTNISNACGRYCINQGTGCVVDSGTAGALVNKKVFEICNDYGSEILDGKIYCARSTKCSDPAIVGICTWRK